MDVLVSVVIPTYNAGPDLDRCLDSLFAQTLKPDEFEIIVVDDGSTDDTPGRLDRLAEAHPNLRVVHSPHSGWPGRPRNIGTGAATGEFVHFMDQDDRMAPDALRRLAEMGRRNRSDIVLGKVVSDFRGVSLGVYRRNVERCSVHDGPLIDSLTPHKMFRRSFLAEHEIAYPEGQRRLEDQLFMVKAYLATSAVSILADYPSYFYLQRSDKANAGGRPIDPVGYYTNLREVLDVIRAALPAGPDRARLIRRFVRSEMLNRVSEPWFLRHERAFQLEMVRNVRQLLIDVMEPGVTDGFGSIRLLRVGLLQEDRADALIALAERVAGLRADARVVSAGWSRGRLSVAFDLALLDMDGRAVELPTRDGRTLLAPALTEGIAATVLDVTDEIRAIRVAVSLRDPGSGLEWAVPTKVDLSRVAGGAGAGGVAGGAGGAVALRANITIDPALIALGHPLGPGHWRIHVSLSAFGLDRSTRLADRGGHDTDLIAGPSGDIRLDVEGLVVTGGGAHGGRFGGVTRAVWNASDALSRTTDAAKRVARRAHRRMPGPVRRASVRVVRAARSRARRPRPRD